MTDKHLVNGISCKDPNCWCKMFPSKYETKMKKLVKNMDDGWDLDFVNNPKHYKLEGLDIEALDVIRSVLTDEEYVGYLRGNIIKYQLRAGKKDHKDQDLAKANYYSKELDECL